MIRSWVYDKDGKAHEVKREASQHHFVQADIEEHGGRAAWRERLKQNNSIEMSPAEMKAMATKFREKKAAEQARLQANTHLTAAPANVDVMKAPDYERSRLNKEMRNRLDGRPMPDRKMLIKLTLETERMLRGR